jgi:hypothetical protein
LSGFFVLNTNLFRGGTMLSYKEFTEQLNEQIKPVKLKQGNVQIVTPLKAIKDPDWGDYSIDHPKFPKDSRVDANKITIKNGMVVGMTETLAKQLGIETVGDKFGKTPEEQRKEKESLAKEKAQQDFKNSATGAIVKSWGIKNAVSTGKISKEQGELQLKNLADKFNNKTK